MNKKIYVILVILIFIFAIVIRIINYPNAISDINCDEAMTAINAKSIAETGHDIYGTSYPVYFEGWLTGGQSAFATYMMALFIKILGFSTLAIRLPILIMTIVSMLFILLLVEKVFDNKYIALISILLVAINPWSIVQSQWVLDCNFFPHMLIISMYLLVTGIKDKKNVFLYGSMVSFALTLYTYGIALYIVLLFLFFTCIYLLVKKEITPLQILICILIFGIIATPIILMSIVNMFDLPTIQIGKLTIQNFKYFTRTSDMLIFSENKLKTLKLNSKYLLELLIKQNDKLVWNSFPNYGTIYLISMPFVCCGVITTIMYDSEDKEHNISCSRILIIALFVCLICGILINDININRLNAIWYILLIYNAIGIYELVKMIKFKKITILIIAVLYTLNFYGFIKYYYKTGCKEITNSHTWSKGLVDSIKYVNENSNINKIVISQNTYNTDKRDIFIRYATKNEQIERIKKEDFFTFHTKGKKARMNYSTKEKEYVIEDIKTDTEFNEQCYVITKNEFKEINKKTENMKYIEFKDYIILQNEMYK